MKKVSVCTIDTRKFIEDLLALGKVGGVLTDECIATKGMFLRAEVLVPVDAPVELSERVALSAESVAEAVLKKDEPKAEVAFVAEDRKYSREELEGLTIKQVKDATGLSGRDKSLMINEYLSVKEDKTEDKEAE